MTRTSTKSSTSNTRPRASRRSSWGWSPSSPQRRPFRRRCTRTRTTSSVAIPENTADNCTSTYVDRTFAVSGLTSGSFNVAFGLHVSIITQPRPRPSHPHRAHSTQYVLVAQGGSTADNYDIMCRPTGPRRSPRTPRATRSRSPTTTDSSTSTQTFRRPMPTPTGRGRSGSATASAGTNGTFNRARLILTDGSTRASGVHEHVDLRLGEPTAMEWRSRARRSAASL